MLRWGRNYNNKFMMCSMWNGVITVTLSMGFHLWKAPDSRDSYSGG